MRLTPDGYHRIDDETALRRGDNIHFGPTLDLLKILASRLDRPPLLLDCGCGGGQLGAMLRAHDVPNRYVGLDLNFDQLRVGRDFYAKGDYLAADATALPFGSQAFDAVVSQGVLFILPEMWTAVKELYRVASHLVVLNLNVAPLGATTMRLHYGGKDDAFMWMPNLQYCLDRFAALGLPEPAASILWETPEDVGHDRKVYRGLTHRFNASFAWWPEGRVGDGGC